MPALLPAKAVSVSLGVAVVAASLVGFAFSEEEPAPDGPDGRG